MEQQDPRLQVVLVAESLAGEFFGSLEMVRGSFQKNRHTATFGMALDAACRGRGIGEGLLLAAHAWAREMGVEKITLSVFATNAHAIHLYRRMGYVEEARRPDQFRLRGRSVAEVLMACFLAATQ